MMDVVMSVVHSHTHTCASRLCVLAMFISLANVYLAHLSGSKGEYGKPGDVGGRFGAGQ